MESSNIIIIIILIKQNKIVFFLNAAVYACFKGLLPEALENDCTLCSEKQKLGFNKIIEFMMEKKIEMWKQLEEKYDPQGTYRQRLKQ